MKREASRRSPPPLKMDADKLRGRYDAVVEALALVKEMDGLRAKIGRGNSPNFGDLTARANGQRHGASLWRGAG